MEERQRDQVLATVVAPLPNAMYRLRLENGQEIDAHVAGAMRMSFIRILPGDQVWVQISPFDDSKGRISRLGRAR